jgi:hypothetical protein
MAKSEGHIFPRTYSSYLFLAPAFDAQTAVNRSLKTHTMAFDPDRQ